MAAVDASMRMSRSAQPRIHERQSKTALLHLRRLEPGSRKLPLACNLSTSASVHQPLLQPSTSRTVMTELDHGLDASLLPTCSKRSLPSSSKSRHLENPRRSVLSRCTPRAQPMSSSRGYIHLETETAVTLVAETSGGPSSAEGIDQAPRTPFPQLHEQQHEPQHEEQHEPSPGKMSFEESAASGTEKPASPARAAGSVSPPAGFAFAASERTQIRGSWDTLMRWSKVLRSRSLETSNPLESTTKVVVFGGGSFGTAMAASLASQKADMEVILLLRDSGLCNDINTSHYNTRYLPDFKLPANVRATTIASEAIVGAQFAVHAVPVQSSRAFLKSIKELLPVTVPIISVSKGLECGTGLMMSELIPSALDRKQPSVFMSGPSFAREVMEGQPTGLVAACRDLELARVVQELFASQVMRVNTTSDVVGVEICGALKNVLAIAAGIVEGLDLGNNALAALIVQGCSEIRWLAEKMGARPTTMSGLSGLGDIMLTCYGSLSRNRSVGIRLGKGEKLADIVASSKQVAEGVATAGVVILLARKYRVSLPVLTAVAQVLDSNLTPREAVNAIMNLPQIEES